MMIHAINGFIVMPVISGVNVKEELFSSVLQTVFNKFFNLCAKKCYQNAYKEGIEQGVADLWQNRAKISFKIPKVVLGNACNIFNI